MLTDETIQEVTQSVLEQGRLSKAEVRETWGLGEVEYAELQSALLRKGTSIQSGPPRTGGFEAKPRRGTVIDDSQGDQICVLAAWEQQARDRLEALLSKPQLERISGVLQLAIRQVRKHQTGIDRVANKPEMAAAVVLQHGVDLFCDSDVRSMVAVACKVKHPKKWLPGKAAAVEFVQATGFPAELAGVPAGEKQPDFEYLEPRFSLRRLEDFQLEVKDKLSTTLNHSGAHAIVTLPTGAGKTRVAVESVGDWLTKRHESQPQEEGGAVLWLAHTEELCEQAYACFKQVWEASSHVCSLHLIRFWGQYTQDLSKHQFDLRHFLRCPSVLISTPHRMANILAVHSREGDAVVDDLKRAIGVLIIDEAHRAAAPSYRSIISELKMNEHAVSVAGLTATPFRMEYLGDDPEEGTRELRAIFGRLIEPERTLGCNPRHTLQKIGVLAEPKFEDIDTTTKIRLPNTIDLDSFTEEDIERLDRILAKKTDIAQRRLTILDRLLPIAADERNAILYFGPSVNDAECMTYLLRSRGIAAAVISGNTRIGSRRRIIDDFKRGASRVLCNCEVLTTGFDAPQVTHVVMARPTVSRVLYEQILGRGLRGPKFGGTETCVVLNCIDTYPGEHPPLGYESFRRVWEEEVSCRDLFNGEVAARESLELMLQTN